MTRILQAAAVRNRLGEGPLWDAGDQALYWVDIEACALHRLCPADGSRRVWRFDERVCAVTRRARGGFLLAMESGLAFFDGEDGPLDWMARPEADRPGNRFNDAKCDRQGRFSCGTKAAAGKPARSTASTRT